MTMLEGHKAGFVFRAAIAGFSLIAALPALADGTYGGSLKDEMAPAGRTFEWSFNIGATSDYVFRGISQRNEDPALQGGVDFTYGLFYAGIWSSMVDFGDSVGAEAELDFYAGIKPEWRGVSFDLGVIYYTYPGANDGGAELDFVELKLGASTSPVENLTVGGTVYYSPEYTGETGEVWTFEASAAYQLPKLMMFTPSISALIGYEVGNASDGFVVDNLNDDEYLYWNAGLSLEVGKLTLDFRYWDTDIGDSGGLCGTGGKLCDERFVFSAKVTY